MKVEDPKKILLNFDIFKTHSNVNEKYIPDFAKKFLLKLEESLLKIKDETLEKYIVSNDGVVKVLNELENKLNLTIKKSLLAVKVIDSSKDINLSELYRFSVKNNVMLKRHLNSIYLTSRIYKELYKDNPLMDNLKLRLISVRCKAIRDICLNESKRGKIRHLRCWKNPKFIPSMPKKLKSIVRKVSRELQKYAAKDSPITPMKIDEIRSILTRDRNVSWDVICQKLEDAIITYYKNVDSDDSQIEQYMKGLKEICEAQNKVGDNAILNFCDDDLALEYLSMRTDDIEADFSKLDRSSNDNQNRLSVVVGSDSAKRSIDSDMKLSAIAIKCSENAASEYPEKKEEDSRKEEVDMLDLDNFQLVDVWEEKNDESASQTVNETTGSMETDIDRKETREARKKRRSRFGPLTEDAMILLQQPKQFGFCSTFVDEEAVGDKLLGGQHRGEISASSPACVLPAQSIPVDQRSKVDISAKMFDVVAPSDEVNLIMEEEEQRQEVAVTPVPAVEEPVQVIIPLDKGELCKAMLVKFHDSLKQAIEGSNKRENWNHLTANITGQWASAAVGSGTGGSRPYSVAIEAVSKVVYGEIENKINVLLRDHLNRNLLKRKSIKETPPASSVNEKQSSPSPTPFDQTIEASMKKTRTNPPVVMARRPTRSDGSQSSPERARLRAMMLSYKRDIEKSREREEVQIGQGHAITGEGNSGSGVAEKPETIKREHVVEEKPQISELKQKQKPKGKKIPTETDSEGLVSSSDDNDNAANTTTTATTRNSKRKEVKHKPIVTSTPKETKVEKNRMQWLVPPPEAVPLAPIPAPATPFLDEESQSWSGRKVFVVDSHDKGSTIALMVKAFLQKNGARVYDTTNYKTAGKDLHVLVHQDWRFPDGSSRGDNPSPSSPISLLLLKNNSGVHFLSYTDVETVSRFSCQTVFPHSRSCLFLDQHALINTHAENIRNMLEFMINERRTSNRIWCLKIPCGVYKLFSAKLSDGSAEPDVDNLKEIRSILNEYSMKYSNDDSMCLVEIQTVDEDIINQQEHVLNQQYYLQKKFRHFCILTDNLNTTELDIGFLSIYGVAVLSLSTFLTNKTGKYIKKAT